jgi:hypothetical protein
MKLRAYLETTNTSVMDFSKSVGVTGPTVWRWLSNSRHPNREQMLRVFAVTKGAVTPNDLVLP